MFVVGYLTPCGTWVPGHPDNTEASPLDPPVKKTPTFLTVNDALSFERVRPFQVYHQSLLGDYTQVTRTKWED